MTNKIKDPLEVSKGKKAKRKGGRFEVKARKDMEEKGWIVDRWSNQVDFDYEIQPFDSQVQVKVGKLVKAKSNRFNMRTTGFPDFVCFRWDCDDFYEVWGVECKLRGKLDKIEKEKCSWYLKNKIFGKIFIASFAGRLGVKYEEVKIT